MSDEDRPRQVIVIRVGGILGEMRRNEAAAAATIPRTESPQLGRDGVVRPAGGHGLSDPNSPATGVEEDSTVSSCEGTPLQDE